MAHPLFPNQQRRQQLQRAAASLQTELNRPNPNPARALAQAERLKALSSGRLAEQARGIADSIRKSAAASTVKNVGVGAALSRLGAFGRIIGGVLRGAKSAADFSAAKKQLELANQLIDQIADDQPGKPPQPPSGGREIKPPDRRKIPPPPQVQVPEVDPNAGLPPNTSYSGTRHVIVRVGGWSRRFRRDDPVITGRMMDVRSSNVHSIGYEFNFNAPAKSLLLVRYLQKGKTKGTKGQTVPGPLYAYDDCSIDLFRALVRAGSKGKWVWDELRIRGSRTAHRKRYKLRSIAQGYIPRRAGIKTGREAYIPRTVKIKSFGLEFTRKSPKPLQIFGKQRPEIARIDVNRR